MKCETKQIAEQRAKELKAKMNNPERWTIRVWENMGWHYCVHCKNVTVHVTGWQDQPDMYFAGVNDFVPDEGKYYAGWLAAWSGPSKRYKNPQKAVDKAVSAAMKYTMALWHAASTAKEHCL